jgi:hypothetical protein
MTDTCLLVALGEILHDQGGDTIYPCIRDLIENGVSMSRFSPGEPTPNRQDVTQYMAMWCRHVGLTEDACRCWLIEYCVAMLSPISRSSASHIRHSTKSNVRYVYRAEVDFTCGRETNNFKAHCSSECPVYADKNIKSAHERSQKNTIDQCERRAVVSAIAAPAVKETYREQFQMALSLVRRELAEKTTMTGILDLLKQNGLKTRTGREWTFATLRIEINKMEATVKCQSVASGR